jgi:site-specific DNA-methyltransferase (adenine-specific)
VTPFYADAGVTLYAGDCLDVMPMLPADSVDAIVTDPPYDLTGASRNGSSRQPGTGPFGRHRLSTKGFMGHEWDGSGVAFDPTIWAAALRLAKPGAWMLVFGGRRTHHRLTCAVEDAGWEVFDELIWMFAQGMPKGRSTLKPAHEPIVMARKPAPRVTPLQIDEARIPFTDMADLAATTGKNPGRHGERVTSTVYGADRPQQLVNETGRWPANVVLTDAVLERGAEGVVQSRAETARGHVPARRPASMFQANEQPATEGERRLDVGSYSRYFLIPKAGRAERNAGLEDLDEQPLLWSSGTKSPGTFQSAGTKRAARNHHPTVKPLELMSHLVRLVTPPGGVCLDPFLGSGTTAVAAVAAGRRCIGIERDESYLPLAPRRLRLMRGTEVPS